jgi:uncharacterized protein (DUF2141 family)
MKRVIFIICISVFVIIPYHSIAQSSGTLIVEIGSFENDEGKVAASIYNSEEGFPGSEETMIQAVFGIIKNGIAMIEFKELPFGEYGVSAFHDENENDELDTNWIGIPKEGIGASNNTKGKMGPPKYEDAKFKFDKDNQKIHFEIIYI